MVPLHRVQCRAVLWEILNTLKILKENERLYELPLSGNLQKSDNDNNCMFNCSTHIVECLRNNKVYPKAHSRSASAKFGLEYTEETRFEGDDVNWYVDLKKKINITSYQIRTDAACNWVSKWDIFLSNDTISWSDSVSGHTGHSYNLIYNLNTPQVARYFKIEGSAPGCPTYPKYLAFYWIKIFGSIVIKSDKTCICKRITFNFIGIIIPFLTIK